MLVDGQHQVPGQDVVLSQPDRLGVAYPSIRCEEPKSAHLMIAGLMN
jgi:hypothetical protein